MIKIFLTVRNRLSITTKCIEAIKRHTTTPYQIYVYNNQTNYLIEEHFKYFGKLYARGIITQVTFNTDESTFNAFSKATACNMFGLQHEQDPQKDNYEFLLMLDNDIILTPKWNEYISKGWKYIKNKKLNYIKIVGQLPGGIKNRTETHNISPNFIGRVGTLGGSGLWSVRPNFFTDVGLLNLNQLIGLNKKHDQLYWQLLQKSAGNKPYIMGLNKKIGIHCGRMSGSVCNALTRETDKKKALDRIKFTNSDKRLNQMKFEEFFENISENRSLISDW